VGGNAGTGNPGTGGGGVGGTGSGGGGTGGGGIVDPMYGPREGTFKMLAYSGTKAFRHADSIVTGKVMLQQIADAQGFTVEVTETNEKITEAGLAEYEVVFFMNSTGDIFNAAEEAAYETWITTKYGAFAGVHSSTDTEPDWSFYKEVTGQYYDLHGPQNEAGSVQFNPDMVNHPALKGLPNPWQRNEEWYLFKSHLAWTAKPGFKVLGRKAADGEPIMWVREFGGFRSFYTALGHDKVVFQDPEVVKHVTGGLMWAVRREHLIK